MFIGEHRHVIDDKGRLQMPARFRGAFGEGAVVTRGLDGCLFVYTAEEWKKMTDKLTTLPLTQADARKFSRLMLAGAVDVEIDKQGRINIPSYLREYADLKSNVIVAGLMNRLEIWDQEVWQTQQAEVDKHSDEIAQSLGPYGI